MQVPLSMNFDQKHPLLKIYLLKNINKYATAPARTYAAVAVAS